MRIPTSMGRPLAALLGVGLVGASPVAAGGLAASGQIGASHQAVSGVARAEQGTGTLDGVYCASRANCWAVGSNRSTGVTVLNEALHWNGRRWRLVRTPQPGPAHRQPIAGASAYTAH